MLIPVRTTDIRLAARDIKLFELSPVTESPLPAASAGAHIDVELPMGLRQYSLIVHPGATDNRYVIAVKNDIAGRGGSRYMHSSLTVGDVLNVSAPRNHFPLEESAPYTVLIAGGIGITPIWSMLQRLNAVQNPWHLHYACRSRDDMAFLDALEGRSNVHLHFDNEAGGPLDVASIINNLQPHSHVYCCGPLPMLDVFDAATRHISPDRKHVEYFQAKDAPATEGGYTICLSRSNLELLVPKGKTILEVLEQAGVSVESSCTEGTCGACETKVLEGLPDHRDTVLSAARKNSNKTMMICCSGSKTPILVLDI